MFAIDLPRAIATLFWPHPIRDLHRFCSIIFSYGLKLPHTLTAKDSLDVSSNSECNNFDDNIDCTPASKAPPNGVEPYFAQATVCESRQGSSPKLP